MKKLDIALLASMFVVAAAAGWLFAFDDVPKWIPAALAVAFLAMTVLFVLGLDKLRS
jgi:hypothetical protein